MHDRIVVIDHRCVELHDAFMRFVPRVFPQICFRRWYEFGGWEPSYRAFALFDGEEIVANVSIQRMSMVVNGAACTGLQLGAVGVLPEQRGRGLQRKLMEFVLKQATPNDLVFVFGNDEVVDFYPRFGFRRQEEWIFSTDARIAPQPGGLRRLSVDCASDRALLAATAARARPVTERFGATRYDSVLLWYWSNGLGFEAYYHERDAAIVFLEQDANVLRICDVLAAGVIDLEAYFPHLIGEPIDHVEFGFTPERYCSHARAEFEYLESPLFVYGKRTLPSEPFKFPVLAQT